MVYQTEGKAKLKRRRTREAVALAMQSQWQEAVIANRSIIEVFPHDVDAYNRLGKALTSLGRYTEAREAYSRALDIDPNNCIAPKNLNRLSQLKKDLPPKDKHRVDPRLFIEETGRTALVNLYRLAPKEVVAMIAAGDQVHLNVTGQSLVVETMDGDYLAEVEPKLGLRLSKLMEGGNRYAAAIASLAADRGKVIIRKVFQHPSQAGRPSFPSKAADGFRAYIKETLLKYELEEKEELLEEVEFLTLGQEEIEPSDEDASPFNDSHEADEAVLQE